MTRVIASDVVSFTYCPRRLWYEYNPPPGMKEMEPAPFDALILEMGLEHESAVRDKLAEKLEVVEATSIENTHDLMGARVPVIYQAHLLDEPNQLFGKPDFLLLQADGSYQAADAKFAHSIKKEIGVQIAFYRRILGSEHPGLVYLGTGEMLPLAKGEYDYAESNGGEEPGTGAILALASGGLATQRAEPAGILRASRVAAETVRELAREAAGRDAGGTRKCTLSPRWHRQAYG